VGLLGACGGYLTTEYERREEELKIDNCQLTIERRREELDLGAGCTPTRKKAAKRDRMDDPSGSWSDFRMKNFL
jgi:hypothetical protein